MIGSVRDGVVRIGGILRIGVANLQVRSRQLWRRLEPASTIIESLHGLLSANTKYGAFNLGLAVWVASFRAGGGGAGRSELTRTDCDCDLVQAEMN